jgi:hypothetical protein
VDAVDQFLFAFDRGYRSMLRAILTEHGFDEIEPGAVFWREDEVEPVRVKSEPALRLF